MSVATLLPTTASVVIIGGGIQGLTCAFNLADMGVRHLVVVDASYWQSGASGRNGTLIRGGFGTPEWTELFHYSTQQWHGLSKRIGHNVMYSKRGYMMVAEKDTTADMLVMAQTIHREVGVKSELFETSRLARQLPAFDQKQIRLGLLMRDGGVAPHHAAMKGLLDACLAKGVQVHYRTPVTGIDVQSGAAKGVMIGDHRIAADAVMIAAGGQNLIVGEMAGIRLPGYAMRIEAMALEPLRPLIGPALALIDSLCYLHQTARGEVVGGTEVPERPRISLATDYPVQATTAAAYARLMPRLRDVRILRHWAGLIHATPDYAPLLGEHPVVKGLWVSGGWSYGWAGGPGAGALMAKAIGQGEIDRRMMPFALDRFERNKPINDPAIVLI
jgi:sarcosine oxidase, subunit beta